MTVGVRANPDGTTHAGYGGVATCGSVWCCPQCAAVVATRRADELADVMRTVDDLGGSAFLLTLTMRHNTGDRLGWDRQERREWTGLENRRRDRDLAREIGAPVDEDQALADTARRDALERTRGCWDALSYGWARVTSGKQWTTDQRALGGLLGWVRVVETTHGVNGWHCHLHVLLCFADEVPLDRAARMAERAFRRWQNALARRGFDTSGDYGADGKRPGWDLRRAQLGDGDLSSYFTKLAHEVTSAHRKEGRRPGGRTPMQLGADAVETYRVEDVDRWREWQRASEGRRQITWSGGQCDLRKLANLGPEQTDEEIADEEVDADERLRLSADVWGWVRASDHVTDVLEVAEDHGLPGLAAWLTDHGQDVVTGIGLTWVDQPPPTPSRTIASWDGGTGVQVGVIPRDEGTGVGFDYGTRAVLRGRDPHGRPQRRPSDRPPRWSDEARSVLSNRPSLN